MITYCNKFLLNCRIPVDKNMAVEDMWGSIVHNIMLGQQGIVPAKDSAKIISTLLDLQNEYIAGKWQLGTKQDGACISLTFLSISVTNNSPMSPLQMCTWTSSRMLSSDSALI